MSIEKLIHRKASDYVAALQNPHAPELEPRKAGRPPIGGETATHHVHIRTTAQRKSAWVRAAKPRTLAEWVKENLDRASKYEPTKQD
jgi:hypothetical protein